MQDIFHFVYDLFLIGRNYDIVSVKLMSVKAVF